MKKLLILFLLLFVVGCSSNKSTIKQTDIEGYWRQTESNWSGDITDMTDNSYAYLEITENHLFFYTESSDMKGYYETIAEKYYILEGDQLYYDYYELTGDDWKANISYYGGICTVSFENDKLVLTELYGETEADGYEIDTYEAVSDEDRLLSPQ